MFKSSYNLFYFDKNLWWRAAIYNLARMEMMSLLTFGY